MEVGVVLLLATLICSSIYRRNRCLERIRKAKNRLHILKRQLARRRVVFAASFFAAYSVCSSGVPSERRIWSLPR